MLRSCLVLLAAYALLFAGYAGWLGSTFDPPGQYIGGGVLALFVGGCFGALYNARVAYREWSLVAGARAGLPLTDGRWSAAAGEIRPIGDPLLAPFSGQACVLCEYDATSHQRVAAAERNDNHTPGSDYTGFLMNPCAVHTTAGEVRLLGFPNLVGYGERICGSNADVANAYLFLTTTEFEQYKGVKLLNLFSAIKAAWTDDDGFVRKNLHLGKATPDDLIPRSLLERLAATAAGSAAETTDEHSEDKRNDELAEEGDDEAEADEDVGEVGNTNETFAQIPLLKEKRVNVGDQVCAIGIYRADKGGLVPGGLGADRFIKLIRGQAAAIERQSRRSALGQLIGGLIGLVVLHGAAFGVMAAARSTTDMQKKWQREAFQIATHEKPDLARLAKLLARGVGVDARDDNGRAMLHVVRTVAAAQFLIARGANVNAPTNDGLTPLRLADAQGRADVADTLRKAGAKANAPAELP